MSRTWRPVIRQRQWARRQQLTGARPGGEPENGEGPRPMWLKVLIILCVAIAAIVLFSLIVG